MATPLSEVTGSEPGFRTLRSRALRITFYHPGSSCRFVLVGVSSGVFVFVQLGRPRERAWSRNWVRTAALGLRKPDLRCVHPSSRLTSFPRLHSSCPLCRSCASRHPLRPPLWPSLCWSSWRRSSCCSPTPPNLTSASRASAGLLWWGLGLKHFNAGSMCN